MKKIVALDYMPFGFIPGKGTIYAIIILWWMQEEYLAKETTLYMRLVYQEKAFGRVPRKVVEWAMRKKGIPEAFVTAVLSL